MIPIEPIGPGAPSVNPLEKSRRVRRAPKRSRDESGSSDGRDYKEPADDEDELEGDDEAPHVDLRA